MNHRFQSLSTVGLMAKYWTAGQVKTRLAGAIGPLPAARLHHALVLHMLGELAAAGDRRIVAVAPDARCDEFLLAAADQWEVAGQGGGDLGERMKRLLQRLLGANDRAVLVGADCPELTAAAVDDALRRLAECHAVMGPAADGGYYLIGLRGPWRDGYDGLFDGIDWGTEIVAEQTRRAASEAGLRLVELDVRHDVDRPEDLRRLRDWMRQGGGGPELRRAVLAAIGDSASGDVQP